MFPLELEICCIKGWEFVADIKALICPISMVSFFQSEELLKFKEDFFLLILLFSFGDISQSRAVLEVIVVNFVVFKYQNSWLYTSFVFFWTTFSDLQGTKD